MKTSLESTEGIILRTRALTETSLIVCWLTPDFGRVSTVAKGARRPKSPFRGKLDLFHLGAFSFRRSRRSELHNLSEVSIRTTHSFLRQDIGALGFASYCGELIELTTESDTPLPEIYELMGGFLTSLAIPPVDTRSVFAFELKLLDELGLAPDTHDLPLPPGTRALLQTLRGGDWANLKELSVSKPDLAQVNGFLCHLLAEQLGRIPKHRERALVGYS